MITANIKKAIYLNNAYWADVDSTSINGVLDCWGVTPSMIEFNLNRHFDSHKSDSGSAQAQVIRHLDNIKLVIIPENVFYDTEKYNGEWPTDYDGNGNYPPTADTLDDYLRWQGVYVDPVLNFSINEMSFSESFDVTCYDYRWCLNNVNFRTPPLLKYVWESGDEVGGTELIGWNSYGVDGDDFVNGKRVFPEANNNSKLPGYEFVYNDFLPETSCGDNPKSWVQIAEHIIRTMCYSYRFVPDVVENMPTTDPGSIWAHIPNYEAEFSFNVNPTFAGLRIDSDSIPLVLNTYDRTGNKSSFDYDPLASTDDTPYAYKNSEIIDRSFQPDPIALTNIKFLNALQTVLDTTGAFEMYMDQFNTLRFVRQLPPTEITVPNQDENPTGNLFDNLYVIRFADKRAGLTISNDELQYYGARGISGLHPRAVPEANRVVGLLKGRAPLAHDVLNDTHNGDLNPENSFSGVHLYASYARDTEAAAKADIAARIVSSKHFSEKIYAATGNIAKPNITPFLYKTIKKDRTEIPHTADGAIPSGWLLKNGSLTTAADSNSTDAIETTVTKTNGDVDYYRYSVDYSVSRASLSVIAAKSTKNPPDSTDAGGGHNVALSEDAFSVFSLLEKIEVGSDGFTITTGAKFVAITHIWDVDTNNTLKSTHRKQFVTNQADSGDDGSSICLYAMGVAPASEIFSIDSSYQDSNYNDWTGFFDNGTDAETFPGLGEFDRAVISAPVIIKTVEELTPTYTDYDDENWIDRWNAAKTALKEIVKNTALRLRQLVTEGVQPHLYDSNLKLEHRIVVWGTRDDQEKDENHWMRLANMKSRINAIRLNTNDEIEIELTTEKAMPEFSLMNWAQNT